MGTLHVTDTCTDCLLLHLERRLLAVMVLPSAGKGDRAGFETDESEVRFLAVFAVLGEIIIPIMCGREIIASQLCGTRCRHRVL